MMMRRKDWQGRFLLPILLLPIVLPSVTLPAARAEAQSGCLSSEQVREAVGAGHAVPAMAATRAARGASAGEVVRVRLCQHEDKLVYRVTILHNDGRVGHVTIDGSSGKVSEVR